MKKFCNNFRLSDSCRTCKYSLNIEYKFLCNIEKDCPVERYEQSQILRDEQYQTLLTDKGMKFEKWLGIDLLQQNLQQSDKYIGDGRYVCDSYERK